MAKRSTTQASKTMTRKVTKSLPCRLTEAEVLRYGREMAHAMTERERIQGELDTQKQEYKARIEEKTATIAKLSGRVNSGLESREVVCIEVKDWSDATVTICRQDTGEVIEERPMREDEKQMELVAAPVVADKDEEASK